MSHHLHIVAWGAPWPANNSIAIDTFYTIQALHEHGIKIHLHYFCADPNCHPTELNQFCESVHPYYTEKQKKEYPFINCDATKAMSAELSKDNHPILFEGIACTGSIQSLAGLNKKIIVRMYNDECRYYNHLNGSKSLFFQKLLQKDQAAEMKRYENALPKECSYIFPNRDCMNSFKEDHQVANSFYFPLMHPFNKIECKTGIGNFCLYHGDLSDPDNEKAVIWLLTKVFNEISTPLVIAGKQPGRQIQKLAELYLHTCLITDPSQTELDDLISKAHINILPSFSNKKPELKLIHSLLNGRHCITNDEGVIGTELESACHIGKNANAFRSIILQLYHQPFEEEEINLRRRIFQSIKKEKDPVHQLTNWLFG